MSPVLLLWLLLVSLVGSAAEYSCVTLMAQVQRLYPHGWYNYIRNVTEDARSIAEALGTQHPHISSHHLQKLMEFALENAAAHGSDGAGSRATFEVNQTADGFLQILVRNPKVKGTELPSRLKGTVFTPQSPEERIPDEERHRGSTADRSGGLQAKGLPGMIGHLRKLVQNDWPTTGPATMQWREVEVDGAATIEFELRLPLSTRVLRERRRP